MRRRSLSLALLLIAAACTRVGAPHAQPTPAPAATSPTPVPTRSETPALRIAAVGDIGDGSRNSRRLAAAVIREHERLPFDVILLLGDMIYPDGDPDDYERKFFDLYRPLAEEGVPMRAALGNHDIMTDRIRIQELFGMPHRYYAFDMGPVKFLAIDDSTSSVDPAQRTWVEEELSERTTEPWKIAFMHVPMFSSGWHGSAEGIQASLAGIFERYDVQVVLAGHDHHYERTHPIGGTVYVVAGGGCCPRKTGRSGFTAAAVEGLSFTVLTVLGERLTIEAFDAGGSRIDVAAVPRVPAG